jgi:hypothetical protein
MGSVTPLKSPAVLKSGSKVKVAPREIDVQFVPFAMNTSSPVTSIPQLTHILYPITPQITTPSRANVTTSTSSLSASILSLLSRQSFSSSRSLRRAVHSQHPSCGDKEEFKGVFNEALRGLVEEGRIERTEERVIRLVSRKIISNEVSLFNCHISSHSS